LYPDPAGRRVLVVDDDKDTADSFVMLLELWGHHARVAYDGPGAIETARDFRPEVVLLDLAMPEMSGFEVVERLRQIPELDATWLVALTGLASQEDQRRTQEAHFRHHLVKPVEPSALQRLLSGDPFHCTECHDAPRPR
jgi:CheY-like chemotaxis protein